VIVVPVRGGRRRRRRSRNLATFGAFTCQRSTHGHPVEEGGGEDESDGAAHAPI